jgi:ketosteroid isomerase-like protein
MAEHPNIQRLRDGYGAFAKGDLATLQEIWAPDIRWHVSGHTDLAGTYEGIPAVLGFLQQVMERTGGTFRVEPQSLFAGDTHAVAVVRLTGSRDGRNLDTQNAHIWRFENDRIAEFWDATADPDVLDSFFG